MLLSGLLKICERESVKKCQCRRVNISQVAWSFLLLGGEERGCALSCWLTLSCCWPVGKREERAWLALLFMLPGEVPGLNSIGHSHWMKYIVAATDLFPFANQWPRQAIQLYTDQSPGKAH